MRNVGHLLMQMRLMYEYNLCIPRKWQSCVSGWIELSRCCSSWSVHPPVKVPDFRRSTLSRPHPTSSTPSLLSTASISLVHSSQCLLNSHRPRRLTLPTSVPILSFHQTHLDPGPSYDIIHTRPVPELRRSGQQTLNGQTACCHHNQVSNFRLILCVLRRSHRSL